MRGLVLPGLKAKAPHQAKLGAGLFYLIAFSKETWSAVE